jgi:hypothetical protein
MAGRPFTAISMASIFCVPRPGRRAWMALRDCTLSAEKKMPRKSRASSPAKRAQRVSSRARKLMACP